MLTDACHILQAGTSIQQMLTLPWLFTCANHAMTYNMLQQLAAHAAHEYFKSSTHVLASHFQWAKALPAVMMHGIRVPCTNIHAAV
jgi:hypothetical protein